VSHKRRIRVIFQVAYGDCVPRGSGKNQIIIPFTPPKPSFKGYKHIDYHFSTDQIEEFMETVWDEVTKPIIDLFF